MKKILTTAAIIGLIAVPSLAFASNGADDVSTVTANVKQEDHQANQLGEANDDSVIPNLPVTASPATAISEAEARTIAQGQQPSKTITKVERETEHGVDVFSVRFSDASRVDVNASSGAIMPADDDDNEEAAEDNPAHDNQEDNSGTNDQEDNSGSGHRADNHGNSNRGRDHSED